MIMQNPESRIQNLEFNVRYSVFWILDSLEKCNEDSYDLRHNIGGDYEW